MSPDDIGTILWCMAGASACDQRAVHAVLAARFPSETALADRFPYKYRPHDVLEVAEAAR